MNKIVSKFGGSSLASSVQLKKVKAIINENPQRQIIVVSAPGKDETNDVKVTDMLMLLHAHIEYGIDYEPLLETLKNRYKTMIDTLEIDFDFDAYFKGFTRILKKGVSKDQVVAFGEYFMALIMAAYLDFTFIDAGDIIFFKHDGTINFEKTKTSICELVQDTPVVVPGFYGSTPECHIRTFNRGGSDLTGSILAQALSLPLYENWTDVSGLFTSDPSIIKDPVPIESITYRELRELSYRGAGVIQQEALIPLEASNITLHILNTNDPKAKGTKIKKDLPLESQKITGMTGSKDYVAITLTKDSYLPLSQILIRVLDVMATFKVKVEHMPTGIDTFSLIVHASDLKDNYFHIREALASIDGLREVVIEKEVALLAVVSRNMSHIPGVAGKIFKTLGDKNINIKVIAQASNELSIIIGVKNEDYEASLQALYMSFYA